MSIGKLMTRGFQNTPYFWILLKIEGAMALQNKAYFFVIPSVYKRWFWTRFQNASWNPLSAFSQLPLVQIEKFQWPSSYTQEASVLFWHKKKFLEIQWNFVGVKIHVQWGYIPNFRSLGDREHSRPVRDWFWKISLVKVLGFWLFFKDCAFTAI